MRRGADSRGSSILNVSSEPSWQYIELPQDGEHYGSQDRPALPATRAAYNRLVKRVDRSGYETKKTTLGAPEPADALARLTPGERVEMVWQLTREAWTFKDGRWDEPRLR